MIFSSKYYFITLETRRSLRFVLVFDSIQMNGILLIISKTVKVIL